MTSKERILNTIYRKPVDRVPISMYELCPFPESSYAAFANNDPSYSRLLKVMLEKTDTIMQTEANVNYKAIAEVTEYKSRREGQSTLGEYIINTPKGNIVSKTRVDDNIFTVWTLEHFLKEPEDIEKYMSLDFTCTVSTESMFKAKETLGDKGIICPSVRDPICRAAELFSLEDFLIFAITEREKAQKFLDFLWELTEFELTQILKSDVKDVMFRIVGPEYATPPYLSHEFYCDFVTKYMLRMAKMINEKGAISRVHSHGKVRYALSEIAKTDVMCVDPLEPIPDGDISLKEAKEVYGSKITFLGNIELKELENSTPEQIDLLVKDVLSVGMKDGGFILMPTATPINIPLSPKTEENMIAMIESGHKYGKY